MCILCVEVIIKMEKNKNFKVGDAVIYVKESYGLHTIEKLDSENAKVLLSTPKLIGEGVDRFWTEVSRIKKIS